MPQPATIPRAGPATSPYARDLAISAVSYDTVLVAELAERLAPRLVTSYFWAGDPRDGTIDAAAKLDATSSRLVLVLHQRLWGQDGVTEADAAALRDRLLVRPDSVCVVTLDDQPVPDWLADAPTCDLAATGVDGVTDLVVEAIAANGGSLRRPVGAPEVVVQGFPHWREGAAPFLAQTRAFSALRHELDAIAAEVKPLLDLEAAHGTDRKVELHTVPYRLIARLDTVGVSFSWVTGRVGTVADGRLLVIQWKGVTNARGPAALKTAAPMRERIYRVEGNNPDSWRWRDETANGRAYSTANLVAEWVGNVSIDAAALTPVPAVASA